MIFTLGMANADNHGNLYRQPETWAKVEKTYRDFLERFPDSLNYRTHMAKHAYDSDHQDIALAQLKILGANWDREVLSEDEYNEMAASLDLK